MEIPDGFVKEDGKVWKLKKGLYGLKQASRKWYDKLSKVLIELGFKQSLNDYCLFINAEVMILIYVDDLIISGKSEEEIVKYKNLLKNKFKMTDSVSLEFFLGLRIERNTNGITLCQSSYINKLLTRFNMLDAKAVMTPIDQDSPGDQDYVDHDCYYAKNYRSIVGSLMYLMVCTRPDLAFAISVASRGLENPTRFYTKLVKRLLQYVCTTKEYSLFYKRDSSIELLGFADADWAGDRKDSKSTSGFVFEICGAAIAWKSKKQETVALSTCEAEYVACTLAIQEAIFIQSLLKECFVPVSTRLYNDNKGCLALIQNPKSHSKTKHINIKHHFIRESLKTGLFTLSYLPTSEMKADLMTKGLGRIKTEYFCKQLGLISPVKNSNETSTLLVEREC